MRFIAERLPAPLMTFAPPDGFSTFPISKTEMAKLGYRLAASSGTAFAAMVKAVRNSYECLQQDRLDPFLGPGGAEHLGADQDRRAEHGQHVEPENPLALWLLNGGVHR